MPLDPFLASSLSVRFNAVKNILFRAATVALCFFLYRLLSFIAYKKKDYTTFVMFSENIVQKSFFVTSRKFNRQAILALVFAILYAGGGFYDTLLWALDFPGYVTRSQIVPASSLTSQMVESPPYLTLISAPSHSFDQINLNSTMGAALYQAGVNFTLSGIVELGSRQVSTANRSLSDFAGPRISLDDNWFAVAVDNYIMITSTMNQTTYCHTSNVANSNSTQIWRCPIQSTDALALLNNPLGQPLIWWDANHTEYLAPDRKDNPWVSYGTGGGTALMKQVFVVTKGFRRHTFLETNFKATMISDFPAAFDDGELTDFVRRTWSTDPGQPLTPAVQTLANLVIAAKDNQSSLTFGALMQSDDGYSAYSTSTDYLTIPDAGSTDPFYAIIRFSATNITLVRSETLDQQPVPFAPCSVYYSNHATGGVVHSTNCYKSNGTESEGHFLGQMDASAVVIVNDILGDGTSNISSVALNETGATWFNQNAESLDNLLLSRGIILGGDRTTVAVAVAHNEAAISHLQLLLAAFPFFLALVILCVTSGKGMSYYKNSFFAAVVGTTHVGLEAESKCATAGYIRCPPELVLREDGGHVFIGTTQGGIIANVGAVVRRDEVVKEFEPFVPQHGQALQRY